MGWGLRLRDPASGAVTFDTRTDEVLFFHDTLSIAANVTGSWSYPALAGQKISIISSDSADPSGGAGATPPTVMGKDIAVTFPNNIPTITATHPQGATMSVPVVIDIFTVGGS